MTWQKINAVTIKNPSGYQISTAWVMGARKYSAWPPNYKPNTTALLVTAKLKEAQEVCEQHEKRGAGGKTT